MKRSLIALGFSLVLAQAGAAAPAPEAPAAAAKAPVKAKAKKKPVAARKAPAKPAWLLKLKCPEGSPLAGAQPADGFQAPDGAGVAVCAPGKAEAGGPAVYSALSLFAFDKDGAMRDLSGVAETAEYRLRAEGGAKLVAERGLRLPAAEKGRARRWVPLTRREAACDGGACSLSPETCGLDAEAWSLAADTVKKARSFAGANSSGRKGKYEEGFSAHLLAAALAGDRSAAHYLQNGGTMFDLEDAARAALAADVQTLLLAQKAGCPVGN